MEETVTGTSWGGGPHQKGQGHSWFQQNKHCRLQILATEGALFLGFPSHQPAAGCGGLAREGSPPEEMGFRAPHAADQ